MYENQFCIVRTSRAGVFFAKVDKLEGSTAQLRDVRRLWYWSGASECLQLAQEGVKKPMACKFTLTVPTMTVLDVIEVIPCTEEAAANIAGVKAWKS